MFEAGEDIRYRAQMTPSGPLRRIALPVSPVQKVGITLA